MYIRVCDSSNKYNFGFRGNKLRCEVESFVSLNYENYIASS